MKSLCLFALACLATAALCQQPVPTSISLSIANNPTAPVRIVNVAYSIEQPQSIGDIVLQLENTSPVAVHGVVLSYQGYMPASCTRDGAEHVSGPSVRGEFDVHTRAPRPIDIAPHQTVTFVDHERAVRLTEAFLSRPGSRYARVSVAVQAVTFATGNEWKNHQWMRPEQLRLQSDDATCSTWKWLPQLDGLRFGFNDPATFTAGNYANAGNGVTFTCEIAGATVQCPSSVAHPHGQ